MDPISRTYFFYKPKLSPGEVFTSDAQTGTPTVLRACFEIVAKEKGGAGSFSDEKGGHLQQMIQAEMHGETAGGKVPERELHMLQTAA